ncbi:hypothetical protein ACFQY0_21085 [Haloferula chungangensis]|uniref:Uncharacterized protein n=2 Tax=Haloferula chungangensis TaxID=1048331 RepID=A0ABW2LB44_9BACT
MPRLLGHFELPSLDVKRGHAVSLLVAGEFYAEESLLDEIAARLRIDGWIVGVAKPARRRGGLFRFLSPSSTDRWLSNEVGVDQQSAQEIISELPIDVRPKLEWNAGNPRNFLGVAAALQTSPDVLIYASLGMDPVGVLALHDFVTSRRQDFFAVYVNWSCDRSSHDADFMALPYSERKWLEPTEENKS